MREIFVFGSNLGGRHGAGAALFALKNHGAKYGVGSGPQGDSYAIPTKDQFVDTLPMRRIRIYVNEFIAYAKANPELTFKVTAIGCGLAGYTPADIAPMFAEAPDNCKLPPEFLAVLGR